MGFGLGVGPLAGFLGGAIGTGVLMAVFLSNSGGTWDNAKKIVEDGHYGGKNSDAHEATIIGDTIGDPFKDTAGPAINPLIKVMNLVALLIAPAVVTLTIGDGANATVRYLIAGAAALVGDPRGGAGVAAHAQDGAQQRPAGAAHPSGDAAREDAAGADPRAKSPRAKSRR